MGSDGRHSCAAILSEKLRIAQAAPGRISSQRANRYESTAAAVADIADEALKQLCAGRTQPYNLSILPKP